MINNLFETSNTSVLRKKNQYAPNYFTRDIFSIIYLGKMFSTDWDQKCGIYHFPRRKFWVKWEVRPIRGKKSFQCLYNVYTTSPTSLKRHRVSTVVNLPKALPLAVRPPLFEILFIVIFLCLCEYATRGLLITFSSFTLYVESSMHQFF